MGILPLQFLPGQTADIAPPHRRRGLHASATSPASSKPCSTRKFANGKIVTILAENDLGKTIEFSATVRIDTPQEILYYQHGGILHYVLRQLAGKA